MLMSSCHLAFEHHIKPFYWFSSLICIANICICLLILYLVLDILLNAQVELGAYLLLNPPPFLHHLIIPPSIFYELAYLLSFPLAHVGRMEPTPILCLALTPTLEDAWKS